MAPKFAVRCTKFRVSHQSGFKASVVCRTTYVIGRTLDIDSTYVFALNAMWNDRGRPDCAFFIGEGSSYEEEVKMLRKEEMGKCPSLLECGPEGTGPALYLFNDLVGDDERESKIGEDEDGGRRLRLGMLTPAGLIRPPKYYEKSVVVGTILYVLGGILQDPTNEHERLFHNKVFFFDTNYPQRGWIKGPDMLNNRSNGKAVALDGKIYVFGGNNKTEENNHSTSRPWAEFLDLNINEWQPLPATPDDSFIHTRDLIYNPVVYGGPGEGKKIFLSCCYYIYDVDVQTWEEFCPPESLRPFSHNLTSVGNILYWTTFGHLYSFNMKTHDIDCSLVEGYMLSKYRKELLIPEPTLLHLGDDYFSFIKLKDLPGEGTKVRCTKFQVSHQSGFKASVACRETYIIGRTLDINSIYAYVL